MSNVEYWKKRFEIIEGKTVFTYSLKGKKGVNRSRLKQYENNYIKSLRDYFNRLNNEVVLFATIAGREEIGTIY